VTEGEWGHNRAIIDQALLRSWELSEGREDEGYNHDRFACAKLFTQDPSAARSYLWTLLEHLHRPGLEEERFAVDCGSGDEERVSDVLEIELMIQHGGNRAALVAVELAA
jgi:hypothetical protein